MSRIPAELREKIRAAVNIIEVVGEHVVLRKAGKDYVGQCPFHADRSPSFYVSESKQLYHCHGCAKGGDVFSFMMETFGISFPEAMEELADRGRVKIPKEFGDADSSDDPEVQKKRAAAREKLALAHKLNRFAAHFFHTQLERFAGAADYFRKRGITEDMKRSFYVGAAPDAWDQLASHILGKKAPVELAVELGLIRPSQKKTSVPYFDLFRNRAMFPIVDLRGKVVGFGGRSLPGSDTEGPKYLNSAGSFLFEKEKVLYGLGHAAKFIREKDETILVEGYFDVLALHAAGFQNAVATCGTSLTPHHLNLLRKLGSKVTVLFDGDKAGISATSRAMELGLEHGAVLFGAAMPAGLDPDEVIFDPDTGIPTADGKERMAAILGASKPLLDSRIDDEIGLAAQGPEALTQSIKKIGGWLSRFTDPVGRAVRAQSTVQRLGIPRDLLVRAMGGNPASQPSGPTQSPARQVQPPRPTQGPIQKPKKAASANLPEGDRILLEALVQGGEVVALLTEARSKLPPESAISDLFDSVPARDFVAQLLSKPGSIEALKHSPDAVLEPTVDSQVRSTLTKAMIAESPSYNEGDLKLAVNRGIARCLARFSQRIEQALAAAEANKDRGLQERLNKEFLDVQRKMKEFSRFI